MHNYSTDEVCSHHRLDEKKLKMLHALYADKSNSVADILAILSISKSTLYRRVKADNDR